MYEIKKIGERTYYFDCPTKAGIYNYDKNYVCLFDSGNDRKSAKELIKRLKELDLVPKFIFNTHAHADHVGGNRVFEEETGCKIYCRGADFTIARYPELYAPIISGSYPFSDFRDDTFFHAEKSHAEELTEGLLPDGITAVPLAGHSFAMNAYKTPDDVWFLGDVVVGEKILRKFGITYLVNVEKHLEALDVAETLEGRLFVPSHTEPYTDIRPLVKINRDNIYDIIDKVLTFCKDPISSNDLLAKLFAHYGIPLNVTQYCLIGGIMRSYLSYLYDRNMITTEIDETCHLFWKRV